MRKTLALIVIATLLAFAAAAATAGTALAAPPSAQVTNSNDDGPGSFRAAVDEANANSAIRTIEFDLALGPIMLESPVVYTGKHSLQILSNGAVLDGGQLVGAAAFLANGGADLSVSLLTVQNAPEDGLAYQVPAKATGTKHVTLTDVTIRDNGGHGVLINDQDFPEEADPPNPAGSKASLDVTVIDSEFDGNGFGDLDRDGLRVNEGGRGSLNFVLSFTGVEGNGGDGIELDERGDGDAVFSVLAASITGNGELDEDDLEDGMDVDESADGAVIGNVAASLANDNFEEGWDINENDAGDFKVDLTSVEASGNGEEGVDFEEDDDFAGGGDLITNLVDVETDDNAGGDGGLKIREKGDGNLTAAIRRAVAAGNQTDGIHVQEDDAGNLAATIERSTADGNSSDGIEFEENSTGDLSAIVDRSTTDGNGQDGVEFDESADDDESGDGNLAGTVSRGSSSNNTVAGVRASQKPPGAGTLNLVAMTLASNGTAVIPTNVIVTQTP